MVINKIGSDYSQINFRGDKTSVVKDNTSSTPVSADKFISSDDLAPPVISDEQLKKHKITDEQIIQMNKSKKLPPNARLSGVPKAFRDSKVHYDSYENRFHYEVKYCWQTVFDKNAKRTIPQGYIAARGPDNRVFVVVEEDTVDDVKK